MKTSVPEIKDRGDGLRPGLPSEVQCPGPGREQLELRGAAGDLFPEKVSSLAGAGDVQNSPKEGAPRETARPRVYNMAGGEGTPCLGVGRHAVVRCYVALALTSFQKYGAV